MDNGAAVKQFSQIVSGVHEVARASYILKNGELAIDKVRLLDLVVVNLFKDEEARRFVGMNISPKDVRKCLFDWRWDRRTLRPNMVMCTVFDSDKNLSYVCLGALVTRQVAERLTSRNPLLCIVMEPPHAG